MALREDTLVASVHSLAPRSVDHWRAGLLETAGFKKAPPDGPATRSVCYLVRNKTSLVESIYL